MNMGKLGGQAFLVLESFRPKQWVKNAFIFAGIVFSGKLFDLYLICRVLAGFVLFSFGAGSIYLVNDLRDEAEDKCHPEKCRRPVPAGRLNRRFALVSSVIVMLTSAASSFLLDTAFGVILSLYLVMNILYSLKLKETVVIDVMTIAAGFVLRVLAGTTLVSVEPSNWLIICTVSVSLFLGFSKRRHELGITAGNTQYVRKVLEHYSASFLDQMIAVMTAITILSYALYTLSEETVVNFGTRGLIFTLPFVIYGMLRYLYLIYQKDKGGNPTSVIFSDMPFLASVLLWVLSIVIIIYVRI